jgi:hypothetical protein
MLDAGIVPSLKQDDRFYLFPSILALMGEGRPGQVLESSPGDAGNSEE